MPIIHITVNNYKDFSQHIIKHAQFLTYNEFSKFDKPDFICDNDDFYIIDYKNFRAITHSDKLNIYYNNKHFMELKSKNGHKYLLMCYTFDKIPPKIINYQRYNSAIDFNLLQLINHLSENPHLEEQQLLYKHYLNNNYLFPIIPKTKKNIIFENFNHKIINDLLKNKVNITFKTDPFSSNLFFNWDFLVLVLKEKVNIYLNKYYIRLYESLESCPITLEESPLNNVITIKCNHKFSLKGMNSWLDIKTNCPLCRTEL